MRPLRADHVGELSERPSYDVAVEEDQRIERLVLGRCRHLAIDREVGQEIRYLRLGHVRRVSLAVKQDEAPRPMDVRLFGADAEVSDADRLPELGQEGRSGGFGLHGFLHLY